MSPDSLTSVVAFTKDKINEIFGESSSSGYLSEYLREIKAQAIIIESHYVDRHYLDEFSNYYSKSFRPPLAYCTRLHFFELEAESIVTLLNGAFLTSVTRKAAQKELQARYLGFVVRRPLDGAPIGRTVLTTYPPDGARRHYEVVRTYPIHLLGMRLKVKGLAYQQQDGGAAVCASTALWSALQRVAFLSGNRSPSPFMITNAAKSPFPASHGLHDEQMAEAISELGYSADRFDPADNRSLFRAKLIACLDSQLPVVLCLVQKCKTADGVTVAGHAVTVTGYAEPHAIGDIPIRQTLSIRMQAQSLDTLYVHDDNLGFHAHYELDDSNEIDDLGNPVLQLLRGRSNGPNKVYWTPDLWSVESALVPKPDKMRLPLEDLFSNTASLQPLIETTFFPDESIYYKVRFDTGVTYLDRLDEMTIDRTQLCRFIHSVSLPRHIAVLSSYLEDGRVHLLDIVLDATSVSRDTDMSNIIAMVSPGIPLRSQALANINAFTESRNIPLLTGHTTL